MPRGGKKGEMAALLALLMRGGMEYGAYKGRKKREERDETLRAEEQKRYEEKLAAEQAKEERLAAQYQGQRTRTMEDAGRRQVYAPPRERFQNPDAMAGREPPMQGFAQYTDLPGKWWEPLKQPEMFTIPGTDFEFPKDSPAYRQYGLARAQMPGGALYTPPEPETLSPYQRATLIASGDFSPVENATAYDLDSRLPVYGGEPRATVADLFHTPAPTLPAELGAGITFKGSDVVSAAKGMIPDTATGSEAAVAMLNALPAVHAAFVQLQQRPVGAGGGELQLGVAIAEFVADYVAGKPEAIAELAALENPANPDYDPVYAALIKELAQMAREAAVPQGPPVPMPYDQPLGGVNPNAATIRALFGG
jgi:hypothetical protein